MRTRKTRKDKGTRKPHPRTCRHCEMVREYREERERQIAARGGFRNETAHHGVVTFKEWLIMYYREQRCRELEAA